jgi:hypothetical protein
MSEKACWQMFHALISGTYCKNQIQRLNGGATTEKNIIIQILVACFENILQNKFQFRGIEIELH